MTSTVEVDIRLDPCCPWAWLTWCWMTEVERVRDVRVHPRLLSLAEINTDPATRRPGHDRARPALRLLVAARRLAGDSGMARLYAAVGDAYQERGEPLDAAETLTAAATAAGFDARLVSTALGDATTESELLAEHAEGVAAGAFGVPTLHLAGVAPFFGPILDRRIVGEDAGALWDRVAWLALQPAIFEIKRERTARAGVGRYRLAAAGGAR